MSDGFDAGEKRPKRKSNGFGKGVRALAEGLLHGLAGATQKTARPHDPVTSNERPAAARQIQRSLQAWGAPPSIHRAPLEGDASSVRKVHRSADSNNQDPGRQRADAALAWADQQIAAISGIDVGLPEGQTRLFRIRQELVQRMNADYGGDYGTEMAVGMRLDGVETALNAKRAELERWVQQQVNRASAQVTQQQGSGGSAQSPPTAGGPAPTVQGMMGAIERRAGYLASPQYQRTTQPPAGAAPGVRIYGDDSTPNGPPASSNPSVTPGHIMATNTAPNGAHASFGRREVPNQGARTAASGAAGAPMGGGSFGYAQPPMQMADNSRIPSQPIGRMPGQQYPNAASDPYVRDFPATQQRRPGQTFSHTYDPRFLPPAQFNQAVQPALVAQARVTGSLPPPGAQPGTPGPGPAATAAQHRQLQYQLMGVNLGQRAQPPQNVGQTVPAGQNPQQNAQNGLNASADPAALNPMAVRTPDGNGGEVNMIPEQNCITDLLQKLMMIRVPPDNAPFITREDLAMLGADANGRFLPNRSIPTQALEQHLRFKEREWLQAMAQQNQPIPRRR